MRILYAFLGILGGLLGLAFTYAFLVLLMFLGGAKGNMQHVILYVLAAFVIASILSLIAGAVRPSRPAARWLLTASAAVWIFCAVLLGVPRLEQSGRLRRRYSELEACGHGGAAEPAAARRPLRRRAHGGGCVTHRATARPGSLAAAGKRKDGEGQGARVIVIRVGARQSPTSLVRARACLPGCSGSLAALPPSKLSAMWLLSIALTPLQRCQVITRKGASLGRARCELLASSSMAVRVPGCGL